VSIPESLLRLTDEKEETRTAKGREATMLGKNDVADAIAFKDIEPVSKLYEGVLGSQQIRSEESRAHAYKRGISRVRNSESQYAPTGRVTSATWAVGDEIDTMLQALKGF
jgi:hypothetical protein